MLSLCLRIWKPERHLRPIADYDWDRVVRGIVTTFGHGDRSLIEVGKCQSVTAVGRWRATCILRSSCSSWIGVQYIEGSARSQAHTADRTLVSAARIAVHLGTPLIERACRLDADVLQGLNRVVGLYCWCPSALHGAQVKAQANQREPRQ